MLAQVVSDDSVGASSIVAKVNAMSSTGVHMCLKVGGIWEVVLLDHGLIKFANTIPTAYCKIKLSAYDLCSVSILEERI